MSLEMNKIVAVVGLFLLLAGMGEAGEVVVSHYIPSYPIESAYFLRLKPGRYVNIPLAAKEAVCLPQGVGVIWWNIDILDADELNPAMAMVRVRPRIGHIKPDSGLVEYVDAPSGTLAVGARGFDAPVMTSVGNWAFRLTQAECLTVTLQIGSAVERVQEVRVGGWNFYEDDDPTTPYLTLTTSGSWTLIMFPSGKLID
jgi:hypothetical protein